MDEKKKAIWKAELIQEMHNFGLQPDESLDLEDIQKIYEREIRPAKCRFLSSMFKRTDS